MSGAPKDEAFEAFVKESKTGIRYERRVNIARVLLSGAATVMLIWLILPYLDEARFHFSKQEIVDLGDVDMLNSNLPPMPLFARVSGVIGNKAAVVPRGLRPGSLRKAPVQIRQLFGGQIFLEFIEAEHPDWADFSIDGAGISQIAAEGRLVPMMSEDFAYVRDYFQKKYGLQVSENAAVLIVGEKPGEMDRYLWAIGGGILLALFSLMMTLRAFRKVPVDAETGVPLDLNKSA